MRSGSRCLNERRMRGRGRLNLIYPHHGIITLVFFGFLVKGDSLNCVVNILDVKIIFMVNYVAKHIAIVIHTSADEYSVYIVHHILDDDICEISVVCFVNIDIFSSLRNEKSLLNDVEHIKRDQFLVISVVVLVDDY